VFQLAPGYDMSAPQPITDIIGELIVDGERPFGRRASNRTITLPVVITVPSSADELADQDTLTGARETLLSVIDAPTWTLTWTRDGGLPLIFDCFRAAASVISYSVRRDRNLVSQVTISFQALPYGRSDTPVQLAFASPVSGSPAPPPSPQLLDDYETISTSGWTLASAHITGSHSAEYSAGYGYGFGYGSSAATYSSTFAAKDLTGLTVIQHWLGVSSPSFYYYFGSGTLVTLAYVLRDSAGRTLSFGTSVTSAVSSSDSSPQWNLVAANLPGFGTFDITQVTGCAITVANYGGSSLREVDVFLDDLTAQPVTTASAASVRGSLYTLHGVVGTSHAPLNLTFEQPAASTPTVVTVTAAGAGTWTPPAGVTTVSVEKWAGSAAGGSQTTSGQASGSKGGEYTKNTAYACTPGTAVPYSVGAGGTASSTAPGDGGDTWFGVNDSAAAHGSVAPAVNTAAAVNTAHGTSTDPVHFAGGSPAAGATTGGGGGESGGPSGAGHAGGDPAGGTGNTDAGDGGAGGAAGVHAGSNGIAPGGGAGGASTTGATTLGGNGANGQLRVTYTPYPLFQTLIAHRPGPESPANLTPFVSTTSVTDPPDGRQYPVTSQVSGQNARFSGTYTIVAVANSWASPSSSRTLTVTVYEIEYPGGPSASQAVSRTFTPSTDIVNGIVVVGELTLPGKDVPPSNTAMYHTVGITDTNTSDQFLDVLLLDTSGETVLVNETNGGYAAYYLDEPTPDRDLGRILGSAYDRTTAVSVLDSAFVSGGPLTVDGGTDCQLLAYAKEGAPAVGASYSPRWFVERLS
jgi:hypothetical protein